MSRHLIIACLFLSGAALASAAPPHLEMELTSSEYASLLERTADTGRASELKEALDTGKRFLDWLVKVNKAREPKHQLSLSSPETMPAYPMDTPREINAERIRAAYDALTGEMPGWLKAVLLEHAELSEKPPVSDTEFIRWGLKVNAVYDNAARWTLLQPFLGQLALRKSGDVRGYYFLKREPQIEAKLEAWESLPAPTKEKYRAWLLTLCMNGKSEKSCRKSLEENEDKSEGAMLEFYRACLPDGEKKWDTYFNITSTRNDVTWNAQSPGVLSLPFKNPGKQDVKDFLVDNIEDEWSFGDWKLKLEFKDGGLGFGMAHIVFEPGATPHVNGLAGSKITMDANVPLTEYAVKWTIRHEFGHVIGLPDCYHEFYDRETKLLVAYQLDISNLMCSRRGKLKEIHYNELKRAYYDVDRR